MMDLVASRRAWLCLGWLRTLLLTAGALPDAGSQFVFLPVESGIECLS